MSKDLKDDSLSEVQLERLKRLEIERAKLEELSILLNDPAMQKDTRENSDRDVLLERIKSQEQVVLRLERAQEFVVIPGTWNIGDTLFIKYSRIVAYGQELELPNKRYKVKLVDVFDISTIEKDQTVNNMELIPIASNTPLGRALLNKAHDSVRFETPVGYCEVELERCLV